MKPIKKAQRSNNDNNGFSSKGKLIIWIGSVLTLFSIIWSIAYGISLKPNEFGDAIGGITAPIIGFLGALLVYMSFIQQYKANRLQIDRFEKIDKRNTKENNYKMLLDYLNSIKIVELDSDTNKINGNKKIDSLITYIENLKIITEQIFTSLIQNLDYYDETSNFLDFLEMFDRLDLSKEQTTILFFSFQSKFTNQLECLRKLWVVINNHIDNWEGNRNHLQEIRQKANVFDYRLEKYEEIKDKVYDILY